MKNLVKLSLTTLAISVLAACGGGGGSKGNSASAPAKVETKPATTAPAAPTNVSVNATAKTGNYGDAIVNNAFVGIDSSANIPNKLVVDGRELTLRNPFIISGGFSVSKGGTSINGVVMPESAVSGTRYQAQFGYVDGIVFYQGKNPTAVLPTGSATYVGDAVFAQKGDFTTQDGGVNLKVNFDAKTLSGRLFAAEDVANIQAVTVTDAKITGNSFSGKAVQGSNSAELKGKFYGVGASEVAGAYSNGTISGAFGAKKQ